MTARLKLAFVTTFPRNPDAPSGGVESVSVNLARALMDFSDLDVHIVTTDPRATVRSETPWERGVVHRLPRRGRWILVDAVGVGRRQMAAFLEELAPDLIHAHDVYGLLVKGLPTPRVHTIHGFIHADTAVAGGRLAWLRGRIWRRVETAAWADQPHIISISPYVRERLAGIARGVIHDIENPIAPAFFDMPHAERGLTIFSAAVVCRRKNTLALVEAFERVLAAGFDARLRLAGADTEPEYGDLVRARIRSQGLEGRIQMLGGLSSHQVAAELTRASVFALVSLEENAPMGIEEAMAVGVPVVASNRCGMPYMVRHGETGYLVDPLDPEAIAGRLGHLLADAGLRERMGEASRLLARERYHPAAVAARTRQV